MSRAAALRESFGDRRPPDISRKITACVSCRKLKVKCNVPASGPPCNRCRTRGLSCTVNKSLQMLLEDDASWKEKIEERLDALEAKQLSQTSEREPSDAAHSRTNGDNVPENRDAASHKENRAVQHLIQDNNHGPALNLTSNLGAFPASSVDTWTSSVTKASEADIVSRNVIPMAAANYCLEYFLNHLNHFLHNILEPDVTLASLRERSSLLTTAVCTVASFCAASTHYQACNDALAAEVSGKLFASRYDYDDVRALCIASCWLDHMGHTLSGLAVRIGSQLDLHRCITKMPHTKKACYDRTRLFYLVYLCDHHCSLKYGRPPMTQEWRSLKTPTAFAHTRFSSFQDLGLISQVELWSITRSVFEQFGADVENQAAIQLPARVLRLAEMYEQWLQTWSRMLVIDDSDHSGIMLQLYFHSAKLYLYSHIHRGERSPDSTIDCAAISDLRQRFLGSAISFLRIMLDGGMSLLHLPSYFSTMLAFATVVLIKTLREGDAASTSYKPEIIRLLHKLAENLQAAKLPQSQSHPLLSIASGLKHAMDHLLIDGLRQVDAVPDMSFDESLFVEDLWNVDLADFGENWMNFDEH